MKNDSRRVVLGFYAGEGEYAGRAWREIQPLTRHGLDDFVAEIKDKVKELSMAPRACSMIKDVIMRDAALLAYRELDEALGLSAMAGEIVADRTGRNGRHALVGMLRQSVFGRLAGYTRT